MPQNALAKANNKFGLDLFKLIRKDLQGKNVFISPLSISSALSMTQIGASKKTALQMADVLGWGSENGEKIHKQFKEYLTILQKQADKYELSTANRIYLEKTYVVNDDFKSKTKQWYLAEPVQANFIENADREAAKINSWVAEQTHNNIKDLLASGTLNSLTRMVLINVIYFKGQWKHEFAKLFTRPTHFKLAPHQDIEVPMMFHEQVHGYYKDKDLKFTAVELLYKGNDISMIIILPDDDYGLEELVSNLSQEKLYALMKGVSGFTKQVKMDLLLPKFEITSSFLLREPLSHLGMVDAFNSKDADFSGVTTESDIFLSDVAHKAFVQVNEEGTIAAAATATLGAKKGRGNSKPFVCVDHPFLFVISDKRVQGSILFLGQVENPSI